MKVARSMKVAVTLCTGRWGRSGADRKGSGPVGVGNTGSV